MDRKILMNNNKKIEIIYEISYKLWEKIVAKNIWWYWFVSNRKYWGDKLTYAKIVKLKEVIFQDKYIWDDLLNRHNMLNKFPFVEQQSDKDNYDHAIGNFACSIYKKAIKLKIISST